MRSVANSNALASNTHRLQGSQWLHQTTVPCTGPSKRPKVVMGVAGTRQKAMVSHDSFTSAGASSLSGDHSNHSDHSQPVFPPIASDLQWTLVWLGAGGQRPTTVAQPLSLRFLFCKLKRHRTPLANHRLFLFVDVVDKRKGRFALSWALGTVWRL